MESKIYTALGLMSGTSLDGVDAAIVYTDGKTIHDTDVSVTVPFAPSEKRFLDQIVQTARDWNFGGPQPNSFAAAERLIEDVHIRVLKRFLHDEGISHIIKPDVVGFHGVTVLHDATRGKSLQLGHGRRLADTFKCPVVYDFRSADVAAGGQGAPLAPVYHKALVNHAGLSGVTAVLNLGGVANVTIVDGDRLLASDTGPANGPLDSWLGGVDAGGSMSRAGAPDFARVESWLQRDFFRRPWPKSADRYDFDVLDEMTGMSREDGAATLAAFTAMSVKHTLDRMESRPDCVVVCGGGRHNRTIMTLLGLELGCPVLPAERVGWDSDAIEAQAFGFMAVRVLRELPNSFPTTTGVPRPTVGGRVAYPSSSRGSRGGE